MQDNLASLRHDLDLARDERDNAVMQVQRAAAAQRQAEAVKLGGFIQSLPPLLSIATRLRSLQATPAAFANAVRSAVPASFELPPPSSPQFLALVPVILAAAVLTSPQAPDLDALASVLRQAVASPAAPTEALNISFAVPAPVPKHPRAAAPPKAPEAPPQPRSPTPSPTDAAPASLLEWITTIPRGCEDEVAHAFHLQLFRHYGANISSLPQSPIREQWTWVRSHAPSLPGIAEVPRTFLASPPSPADQRQSRRLPRRSGGRQSGGGGNQEEGVHAPESGPPGVFQGTLGGVARDGREPGSELVAKDAPQQPRVH